MAGKELDAETRAAERAEMRLRLQARIARLLEVRARTARRFAAAGSERPGTGRPRQAAARNAGSLPGPPAAGFRLIMGSSVHVVC